MIKYNIPFISKQHSHHAGFMLIAPEMIYSPSAITTNISFPQWILWLVIACLTILSAILFFFNKKTYPNRPTTGRIF